MTRSRSEPGITANQCGTELFGEYDISRIIRRQIVAQLQMAGKQDDVGIACHRMPANLPLLPGALR